MPGDFTTWREMCGNGARIGTVLIRAGPKRIPGARLQSERCQSNSWRRLGIVRFGLPVRASFDGSGKSLHQRFYYWFPGRAGHRFVVSL